MENNKGCSNCMMWTMDLNSGKLDFPPPKDYPLLEIPSTGKLRPIKLSYNSMSRAIEEAHKKIVNRSWTAGNVESYLKVNGLNTSIIKKCYRKCMECTNIRRGSSKEERGSNNL